MLQDRDLFFALAHVASCLKSPCRSVHYRLEPLYHAHPDIPVSLMAHLANWREQAEGPYAPPRATGAT